MKVTFTKEQDKKYFSTVLRNDGVLVFVPGVGKKYDLPHDFSHFIIEKSLGLEWGFWGCIAKGALFKGMKVLEGRQKPHAKARSKNILKEAGQYLTEAEGLVSIVHNIRTKKVQYDWIQIREELKFSWRPKKSFRPALSQKEIEVTCNLVDSAVLQWEGMSAGDHISVIWTLPE